MAVPLFGWLANPGVMEGSNVWSPSPPFADLAGWKMDAVTAVARMTNTYIRSWVFTKKSSEIASKKIFTKYLWLFLEYFNCYTMGSLNIF